MATEKKTTAQKAATKRQLQKTSCKKDSEGCGKAYRTREERPLSGRL